MTHKNIVFGLLVMGIALAAAFPVSAQKKAMSFREYYEGVYPKPAIPWHERSRRVENVRETLENGNVIRSETRLSEVLEPDRSRVYTKTVQAGKVTELEVITIEHMQFTRKDGGQWSKLDLRTQGTGIGSGTGSGSSSCSQYTVEPVFVNGMTAKLFEELNITSDKNELTFTESRHWVGEDGLPYRQEYLSGKVSPRIETSRNVTTFDYTANFKIEAPIK